MSRTIVQEYGPIYGEAVNGTVMGRPNGSVYVPSSNTILIEQFDEDYRYIRTTNGDRVHICTSDGSTEDYHLHISATSQDLSSYIQTQVYSDSGCTTLVASRDWPAGYFNFWPMRISNDTATLVDGTTYYFRAQLMNNGVAIATSDTYEVTGVVP